MTATLIDERTRTEAHGDERGIVTRMELSATAIAEVQGAWAARQIAERLAILKRARHLLASRTDDLCAAIPSTLARNPSDTRVAEVLPLLAACKFLEDEAAEILATQRLGTRSRPLWLARVWSEVHRVPVGRVLVIAPSNYPLFLAGVQVLQALAAGNSVIWKPGLGGARVAEVFAKAMREARLPDGLLRVTDESVEAAQTAIADGVDKVFFTGSVTSGKALMRQLAETLTPCVAELSGCDAVFVLPSANLPRVVKALAFGMRLNGSATCMAPRRIILVGADSEHHRSFVANLAAALNWVKAIAVPDKVRSELCALLDDAAAAGARVHGDLAVEQQPVLVTGVTPDMRIARADLFAPVLSLMEAPDMNGAIAMHEACPFSLTASIFGDETEARKLAEKITAGTITINDLMVPVADPRIPFGGRRQSGFGVTRGREGLLEMTVPKTIAVRRGTDTRHFDATTPAHQPFLDGFIAASHAPTLKQRFAGVLKVFSNAKNLN